jgi:glycosyltransferase involved in cell wall biosynthesis/phospholipid N-methyltransferase
LVPPKAAPSRDYPRIDVSRPAVACFQQIAGRESNLGIMSTTPTTNQVATASSRLVGGAAVPSRDAAEQTRTSTTLSVLVPAYNEQYLIEASLQSLAVLDESPRLQAITVIVVDDCSTDGTAEAIRRFQSHLESSLDFKKFNWIFLRHEKNSGKGAAIRTALAHVVTHLVVIHDADLEYHPRDLLQMVDLFLYEDADAVFGSRFMPGGYKRALFFRHALGNKLLTLLCDLVCDLNLTDMETCYKMVRADLLKSIPLQSSTFDVEPELAIKLAKRGSRIFEVPISYSGRTYAEGKKINWKEGIRALWAIFRYAASDKIYAADGHGGEILLRLNRAPRFSRWMADVIRPYVASRVLEIGAGIGNLTMHLVPRKVYWATDLNPEYLGTLERLRANRPYLRIARVDATDANSFPTEQLFDTVIFLNVLEHLTDDAGALRNVYAALENGGTAVVLVPSGPELYGTLDEVLGHCRRYTEKQVSEVGQAAGFKLERVLKFNRPGVIAWWLNGKILRRTTFGLAQIRLLNLLTPLFRVLDPWLPLPPLSLIAIFRKDDGSAAQPGLANGHAADPHRES